MNSLLKKLQAFIFAISIYIVLAHAWSEYSVPDNFDEYGNYYHNNGLGESRPLKDLCYLDKKVGPCMAAKRRFYYDKNEGICKRFVYGGCHGNENNFRRLEDCQKMCMPVNFLHFLGFYEFICKV